MATTDIPARLDGEEPRREKRMTLGQHLLELRRRLVICAIAVLVAVIAAFITTDWVIAHVLMQPILLVQEKIGVDMAKLNFPGVTSAFNLKIQISLALGFLVAAPVWLWQIWAFIMPAMTRKEIRYTVGFASAAIPLFFAGCAVGLWVAPHMIEIMASFVPEGGAQFLTAMDYYDLIFKLLIATGIAFVVPVFLVALNMAGILTARAILRGWRVAVLVATLFAAIATPAADIISMLVLASALIVLYLLAACLTLLLDRRKRKRNPELFVGTPA